MRCTRRLFAALAILLLLGGCAITKTLPADLDSISYGAEQWHKDVFGPSKSEW